MRFSMKNRMMERLYAAFERIRKMKRLFAVFIKKTAQHGALLRISERNSINLVLCCVTESSAKEWNGENSENHHNGIENMRNNSVTKIRREIQNSVTKFAGHSIKVKLKLWHSPVKTESATRRRKRERKQ